ncbi:flavodoxin family protein [Anaerovorax odorimutans]|uniref:flavodoxin family protein n=1 Tax=Anaerovorax odorimutans TaxID=109327 RepID=UPI00041EB6DF|nr:NAD(P)H-dependent oxidoreductase [Anaerovorax odorimutans]
MKILILNGNSKTEYMDFENYINELKSFLEQKDNDVKIINIRNYQLHDCIGCYQCWLKTPGHCCFHDGMESILKEYLKSEVVVMASPIVMGFISSLTKRFSDRMLPLVHPFLIMREDRMGHIMRYNKLPKQVLLLDESNELDFVKEIYGNSQRDIRNIFNTDQELEVICDEIASY